VSNTTKPPLGNPLSNPITEDDIAHYLSITPDFFQRHAELLAAVQFTSPHSHRAVSLQERQAEMLREKIRVLEQHSMVMMRNGTENTLLSNRILQWARTLLLNTDVQSLPMDIVKTLQEQFSVPQVGIRVWDVSPEHAAQEFAKGVSDDVKTYAASLMEPLCGVNIAFEAVNWLKEPGSVASLALVPLRTGVLGRTAQEAGSVFGLLVLASPDALRFHSGLATDLLSHIGDLASATLSRLR
jgi:uncharacterized protein YigA (DUF484 family)